MKNNNPAALKKKKLKSIENLKATYGRRFVLMWEIGFVLFFLLPLVQSVWFAFSNADPVDKYDSLIPFIREKFAGLTHFKFLLFEQADFVDNFVDSISMYLYSLPLIIVVSFIIAVFLNDNFRGRLFFRAVYFLPVIIASGAVMSIISNVSSVNSMLSGSSATATVVEYKSVDFVNMLNNMGMDNNITSFVEQAISAIFNLLWSSGVQIILFLAGLQSIPTSLIEVSRIEGATAWERLWYITVPMMKNIISLNLVYTSIALLTSISNPLMTQMYDVINQGKYNIGSAMVWLYCPIIMAIVIVLLVLMMRIEKRGDAR